MRKLTNSKFAKILSLTLALIFIFGAFAGCGKDTEEETTTEVATTQAPRRTPKESQPSNGI